MLILKWLIAMIIFPVIGGWSTMIASGIIHAHFLDAWQAVGFGSCYALSFTACLFASLVGAVKGALDLSDD